MYRILKLIPVFILCFTCCFLVNTKAQNDINLSLNILPPYPYQLEGFSQYENQVVGTIMNNTNEEKQIEIRFTVTGNNGITLSSIENTGFDAYTIGPNEFRTLTGSDIFDIGSQYQLDDIIDNFNSNLSEEQVQQFVLQRLIPEGTYEICLTAYDYVTHVQLSPAAPVGCTFFTVTHPGVPVIITPQEGEAVVENTPVFISWNVPGYNGMGSVVYGLKVIDLENFEQLPLQEVMDLPGVPVVVEELELMPTSHLLDNFLLQTGHRYAIRVTSYDPSNNIDYETGQKSEIVTFTYGIDGSDGFGTENFAITPHFPALNDTLPFARMPFVLYYEPHSSRYRNFDYTININAANPSASYFNATDGTQWDTGPLAYLRYIINQYNEEYDPNLVLPASDGSDEYAQYFLLSDPAQMEDLQKGRDYTWEVNAVMDANNAPPYPANMPSISFQAGMPQPHLMLPLNEAVLEDTGKITLHWHTGNAPDQLLPRYQVFKSQGSDPNLTFQPVSDVSERYALQLARDADFQDIVYNYSEKLAYTAHRNFPTTPDRINEPFSVGLRNYLYKPVETDSIRLTEEGDYFWRVLYLNNPDFSGNLEDITATDYYRSSPVYTFSVGEEAVTQAVDDEDPFATDPEPDCMQPCLAPDITNTIAVIDVEEGDTVKIGLFDMKITEITWAGNRATGKGHILKTPYFKAPIKVKFDEIRINMLHQVFEDSVTAEIEDHPLFNNNTVNALALAANMDSLQLQAFNDLVGDVQHSVDFFTGTEPKALPFGIDFTVEDYQQTIGVVNMIFLPQMATLEAVLAVEIPQINGRFGLGARDICFSPGGINAGLGMTLFNPADRHIGGVDMTFHGSLSAGDTTVTRVSWNCRDGLTELVLHGWVSFPSDKLEPVDADGLPKSGDLLADFHWRGISFSNFIFNLSFRDRFQSTSAREWIIQATNASLDMSSLENPTGFVLPDGYSDTAPGNDWEGFYLKDLNVTIPKRFAVRNNPSQPVTTGVNHFIYKRHEGISGKIYAANLLTINDGDYGGWAISVDTVNLTLIRNDFENAYMRGKILLPTAENQHAFYKALISKDNGDTLQYDAAIMVGQEGLDFPFIDDAIATVHLEAGSKIKFHHDNQGSWVKSDLTGNLTITLEEALDGYPVVSSLDFKNYYFQSLKISSKDPHWDCASCAWSHTEPECESCYLPEPPSQSSVNHFPVNVSGVHVVTGSSGGLPKAGIRFTVGLVLGSGGDTSNIFNASTTFTLWGKLQVPGGTQKWVVADLDLDTVNISGDIGVVEFDGQVVFYQEDNTYGDGFRGKLRVEFVDKITVDAIVQVGSVNNYKYWMVDGLAMLGVAEISLFPGVSLKGFGGGAYKNMKLDRPANLLNMTSSDSSQVGGALTNAKYIPLSGGGGFNAKVVLGPPAQDSYRALVTFGAQWQNGSITDLMLDGKLVIMPKEVTDTIAPVQAQLAVNYNLTNQIVSGQFNVSVNLKGGMITGGGPSSFYFDSDTWFIKVGSPPVASRINLTFKLDSADVGGIASTGYFMLGENLPSFSQNDLPLKIRQHLGDIGNVENGRTGDLGLGDGVVFGMSIKVPRDTFRFLFLYATAELEEGFDISLLHYTDVECANNGGQPLGFHGWYATGQIYGYFGGGFGMYVDCFIATGYYELGYIGAGAALSGGLPNPTWAKGTLFVEYSILGGAISGSKDFHFKLGTICDPNENSLLKIPLVSEMKPANNTTAVDCGVFPRVILNLPVNTDMVNTYTDPEGITRTQKFRVKYDNLKLIKKGPYSNSTGTTLVTTVNSTEDNKKSLMLAPNEPLNGNMWYDFSVRIWLEEYVNGAWQKVKKNGVEKDTTYHSKFKTGPFPDTIPDHWIAETSPRFRQRYYLQDECHNGFVMMKFLDPEHFDTEVGNDQYLLYGEIVPVSGSGRDSFPVTVSEYLHSIGGGFAPRQYVSFNVPPLLNNKTYKFNLVKRKIINNAPAGSVYSASINNVSLLAYRPALTTVLSTLNYVDNFSDTIRKNTAQGNAGRLNEKVIYKFHFRTSQYNTLAEKTAAYPTTTYATRFTSATPNTTQERFQVDYKSGEPFDVYDLTAAPSMMTDVTYNIPRLILNPTSDMTDSWYSSNVKPRIYNFWASIASDPVYNTKRVCTPGGHPPCQDMQAIFGPPPSPYPPYNKIPINTSFAKSMLSQTECYPVSSQFYGTQAYEFSEDPEFPTAPPTTFSVDYNVPFYVYEDFLDMKAEMLIAKTNHCTQPLPKCAQITSATQNSYYQVMTSGIYKIKLRYRAPPVSCTGGNLDTGEYSIGTNGYIKFAK